MFRLSVTLLIQHAKRMRRIALLSVACLSLPYFSTPSYKDMNTIVRVWFVLQIWSEIFLILRRIKWGTITFMSRIRHYRQNLINFLNRFSKNTHVFSSKSVQRGPICSMRTDRQIWRHKKSLFVVLCTCLTVTEYDAEIRLFVIAFALQNGRWQKQQIASVLFHTLDRRVFQIIQIMEVIENS
jgi:hypothetical protein